MTVTFRIKLDYQKEVVPMQELYVCPVTNLPTDNRVKITKFKRLFWLTSGLNWFRSLFNKGQSSPRGGRLSANLSIDTATSSSTERLSWYSEGASQKRCLNWCYRERHPYSTASSSTEWSCWWKVPQLKLWVKPIILQCSMQHGMVIVRYPWSYFMKEGVGVLSLAGGRLLQSRVHPGR